MSDGKGSGARARLSEVALAADVSVATVDRVLNNRGNVKPQTRERVIDAAKRLGYRWPQFLGEQKPERIDFLLQLEAHDYYRELREVILSQVASVSPRPPECHVHFLQTIDPGEMAEQILEIADQTEGLAVVPLEHPKVRQAIRTVIGRGVPVVTLLTDVRDPRRYAYVGADNRAAGRTAGYIMGRFLAKETGSVAVAIETERYLGQEEREMGFLSVIRERFPDLTPAGLIESTKDNATYRSSIRDFLERNPDLVGIYSAGGQNAIFAEELIAAGRSRDLVIIAHELTQLSRAALMDGTIDAIIALDVEDVVRKALQALSAYYDDGEPSPKPPFLDLKIYFDENLT